MQKYHSGDIVLVVYPFADLISIKKRPALVLVDTGDQDVIVARITSKKIRTAFDVEIIKWQQAGMLVPSIIRTSKVITLEKHLIEKRLGQLQRRDREEVSKSLRQLWRNILQPAKIKKKSLQK